MLVAVASVTKSVTISRRCARMPTVTQRVRLHVLLDPAQRDGLRLVKERDGIPEAEQIRRAVDAWLTSKGVKKPAKK